MQSGDNSEISTQIQANFYAQIYLILLKKKFHKGICQILHLQWVGVSSKRMRKAALKLNFIAL